MEPEGSDERTRAALSRWRILAVLTILLVLIEGYLLYRLAGRDRQMTAELGRKHVEVESLQAQLRDLPRLRAAAAEAEVLKKDRAEMAELRSKSRELLDTRKQNDTLRAEVQKLQAQVDQLGQVSSEVKRLREQNQQITTAAATARQAEEATAQRNTCIANLKQLDGATQQWALESRMSADSRVDASAILRYLRNQQAPVCPAGGQYSVGLVRDDPKCSIPGHSLQ
jgi:myosin heavy subunit